MITIIQNSTLNSSLDALSKWHDPDLSRLPLAWPPASVSASEVGQDDFVTADTSSPSWFSGKGLRVKLGPFFSTSSTSTASLEVESLRAVAETKGKGFFDSRDVLFFGTIMCRNDELSSTMSWVGCLLKDSKLFILFSENSQILLFFSYSFTFHLSAST